MGGRAKTIRKVCSHCSLLSRYSGSSTGLRVKFGNAGPQRVAPLGHHLPLIALRHGNGIFAVGGHRLEAQPAIGGQGARRDQPGAADDESARTNGDALTEKAAPIHHPVDDAVKFAPRGARTARRPGGIAGSPLLLARFKFFHLSYLPDQNRARPPSALPSRSGLQPICGYLTTGSKRPALLSKSPTG